MIIAVLACDSSWGIGNNGSMPWPHNADDLKWFKKQTENKTVVMGRATWESLPNKPLPKRRNIVVTSQSIDGVECYTLSDIKEYLKTTSDQEVCVIGGAKLFSALLPYIDELRISRIQGSYKCDVSLIENDITAKFTLVSGIFTKTLNTEVWKRQ